MLELLPQPQETSQILSISMISDLILEITSSWKGKASENEVVTDSSR